MTREAALLHQALCELRAGARMPTLQARLAVALRCAIDAGDDAPNFARLADQLGVARSTLHHALAALRRKGFVSASVETVAVERVVIELRTVRRITLNLPSDDPGRTQ